MMTEEELELILRRWSLTTGDKWISYVEGRDHSSGSNFIKTISGEQRGMDIEIIGATNADQDFIASCKQDIPRLVEELKRLRQKNPSA